MLPSGGGAGKAVVAGNSSGKIVGEQRGGEKSRPPQRGPVWQERVERRWDYSKMVVSTYPRAQELLTPISPGMMKLWLMMNLPMRVVPERSKPIQARSLG